MACDKVILLNGTSSSGKSSLARALQQVLDEPFHHANPDAIKDMCSGIPDPSKGGAFARWADLPKLYSAVPPCFAALAASGNNLIIDDVIKPLQLKNYVASLAGFVGVRCVGLLGADVLGRFDLIFDAASGTLAISTGELVHSGQTVRLSGV